MQAQINSNIKGIFKIISGLSKENSLIKIIRSTN